VDTFLRNSWIPSPECAEEVDKSAVILIEELLECVRDVKGRMGKKELE
jgi:hypothetical protein